MPVKTFRHPVSGESISFSWPYSRDPTPDEVVEISTKQNDEKMKSIREKPGWLSQLAASPEGEWVTEHVIRPFSLTTLNEKGETVPVAREGFKNIGEGLGELNLPPKGGTPPSRYPFQIYPSKLPPSNDLAEGIRKVMRGTGEIVGPPALALGAYAAPLPTAAFMGTADLTSYLGNKLIEKTGANPHWGGLGVDLLSLLLGMKAGGSKAVGRVGRTISPPREQVTSKVTFPEEIPPEVPPEVSPEVPTVRPPEQLTLPMNRGVQQQELNLYPEVKPPEVTTDFTAQTELPFPQDRFNFEGREIPNITVKPPGEPLDIPSTEPVRKLDPNELLDELYPNEVLNIPPSEPGPTRGINLTGLVRRHVRTRPVEENISVKPPEEVPTTSEVQIPTPKMNLLDQIALEQFGRIYKELNREEGGRVIDERGRRLKLLDIPIEERKRTIQRFAETEPPLLESNVERESQISHDSGYRFAQYLMGEPTAIGDLQAERVPSTEISVKPPETSSELPAVLSPTQKPREFSNIREKVKSLPEEERTAYLEQVRNKSRETLAKTDEILARAKGVEDLPRNPQGELPEDFDIQSAARNDLAQENYDTTYENLSPSAKAAVDRKLAGEKTTYKPPTEDEYQSDLGYLETKIREGDYTDKDIKDVIRKGKKAGVKKDDVIRGLMEKNLPYNKTMNMVESVFGEGGQVLYSGLDPVAAYKNIKNLVGKVDWQSVNSVVKSFLSSGESTLKSMGDTGKKFAFELRTWQREAEMKAGDWLTDYSHYIKGLSDKEFEEVSFVLEGLAKSSNPKVNETALKTRKLLDTVLKSSQDAGVKYVNARMKGQTVRYRSDYFPWKIKPDFLNDFGYKKMAEKLVETGKYKTVAEAEAFIRDVIEPKTGTIMGHLQRERLSQDLVDFIRRDKAVIAEYLDSAAYKIQETQQFGDRSTAGMPQRVFDYLEALRKEGADSESAENIVKELFNPGEKLTHKEKVVHSYASGFEAATKLSGPSTAIKNLSQPVYVLLVTGMKPWIKALVKMTLDPRVSREFANRAGATTHTVIKDIQKESGVYAENIGSKFLPAFNWAERVNRTWAALSGKYFVEDVYNNLKKNPQNAKARRYAKEYLGIEPDVLLKEGLTEHNSRLGAKTVSDRTQFRSTALDIPPSWHSSFVMRLATMYKSFGFNQAKLIKEAVIKEAIRGNVKPLVYFMTLVPAAGHVVSEVINTLNFKKDSKGQDIIDTGNKDLDDYLNWALEGGSQIGAIGMTGDTLTSASMRKIPDYLIGPIGGDIADLFNIVLAKDKEAAVGKFVTRRVPFVGKQLMGAVYPPKKKKVKGRRYVRPLTVRTP